MYPHSFSNPVDTSLSQRALFIAAVVLIHVAVLGTWVAHPHVTTQPHEMTISMTMPASVPAEATPAMPEAVPQVKPQTKPVLEKAVAPSPVAATPAATPTPPAAVSTAAVAATSAPALPDREPDFSAAYLNNPKPVYPLAARRMGWQGKVIVRVEVLANGAAGEVSLYQSSGREALDNAALAAVKSWRFTPARVAGQLITKTFLVPIPFKLESDNE
ncbi:MAG: hypothetical protein RL358_513 [Pseudomonadota bacterium]